jgi:branched-chain amino acid transport system substrate-binding protein
MHIVASVILALTLVTGLGAGPAPAQEAIQIGATAALTGPVSSLGATQGKLWEGWEHAQNEAGGIMVRSLGKKLPIKIIYYDDKSDPKVSVKFYEKLINDDKVHFLIGPMGSPIGFASTTVAERYKFPMLLGPSSDPKIFERGFKYIQGVQDLATEWSRHYFDMHGKLGKAKTMAILAEDILFSRGVADGSKRFAAAAGMKTVFDEVAPKDIEDFTPIVARMKAAGADLAYISSYPPFFIKFAKQAAELGYRPAALHCPLCSAASVRQTLGPLAELVTGEIFWVPGMRLGDYRMLEATLKHWRCSGLESRRQALSTARPCFRPSRGWKSRRSAVPGRRSPTAPGPSRRSLCRSKGGRCRPCGHRRRRRVTTYTPGRGRG